MEDYGFDPLRLKSGANSYTKLPTERQTDIHINKDIINAIASLLRHEAGSQDSNREWEVGGNSHYEEMDDERTLLNR
jgi:hypothetical protein